MNWFAITIISIWFICGFVGLFLDDIAGNWGRSSFCHNFFHGVWLFFNENY